jgi:hypothetical protein
MMAIRSASPRGSAPAVELEWRTKGAHPLEKCSWWLVNDAMDEFDLTALPLFGNKE